MNCCVYTFFILTHIRTTTSYIERTTNLQKYFFILRHLPPQKKQPGIWRDTWPHTWSDNPLLSQPDPPLCPWPNLCLDVNQDPNGNWQQFEQAVSINEKQAKGNHKIKMVAILEVNCYRMLNCAESVVTSSFKLTGAQIRPSEISPRIRS